MKWFEVEREGDGSLKPQSFVDKNRHVIQKFLQLKKGSDARKWKRLNFSWSNWGFGFESLADSAARLAKNQIQYIELHGN
ncbi:MAG: hypothetical protein K6T63_13675 [Alicyclobacillus herbarius]|uniref:hypothetical protein n=1 Tax=Alicyclobacillus herbarius TaxID=122960 RepID=UPI002354D53F|nr:hypothetical protein [Alicyclobacillus herbarius]MCL6633667.1 hypothetical protein [Alicyclobacillus herbarius]